MAGSLDPVDLTDAMARWEAGRLAPSMATDGDVRELRHLLEGAARTACDAAGGADLASNPIRLSKRLLTDLLACERHLILTTQQGPAGGPGDEALHLGVLIDVLAEYFVISGDRRMAPEPLRLGVELCEAKGDQGAPTVAWVNGLEADARRTFGERLQEKQVGLLAGWPAFEARWWPRTQERAAVALAGGDIVLSGRADVTVGGPPTPWPILVIEVKSGGFTLEQRDDGLVYALLLALRDGTAPAAAITATAAGAVHVEAATADRLATAAERIGVAIVAAGELAGGRASSERAGFRCDRCPVVRTCLTAAGRDMAGVA